MWKKIIPYIIVSIISLFIGFIIFSGGNSSIIEDRISAIERNTTEIIDKQREVNNSIESIGSTITGIKSDTNRLSEGYRNIKSGIDKLTENDRRTTEVIGLLVNGNNEAKGYAEGNRKLIKEFEDINRSIEERNK